MERAAAWRAAGLAFALVILWRIIAVNVIHFDNTGRPLIPETGSMAAVLDANPSETVALLVLGGDLEKRADLTGATRAFESAMALAPMDRDVLQHSAAFFLRHGRTAEGIAQLGRLAEHYGEFDKVFPVFIRLMAARDPGWSGIAARNPPWLGSFILAACRQSVDATLLVPLLQARVAARRAKENEIDCVVEKLRAAGMWEAAYLAWLNTLPRERLAEVGHVFNGSFEFPASGVGFDWKPAQGLDREVGHAVDFPNATSGAGRRALRVAYTGKRPAGPAIRQYLAAPPGRYELTGIARPEALNSVRGVQWVLRCASREEARPLAASGRFLGSSEWLPFSTQVVIPPGCAGQVLQLEPVGLNEGTVYVAGTAWFDDLRLARLN
jgi:hypothetical protein